MSPSFKLYFKKNYRVGGDGSAVPLSNASLEKAEEMVEKLFIEELFVFDNKKF